MKVNIIQHNQHDSMCDAESLIMLLRRTKQKPEVTNVPINNSPNNVKNAALNIFIDAINMSLLSKAKKNIIIVNHHTFTPVWKELLVNFDMVLCKTKYCYDIFSEFVPKDKLKLLNWQSSDRSASSVEKEREKMLLMYTDPFCSNLQPILDAWELDYPELNIIMIADIPKSIKKKNLANINYIQNLTPEKFNILFNKCLVHICLSNIENYNHNSVQCQMSKSIPIIVSKGPAIEVVDPDGYFGVSSTKKKNINFLGSKYNYKTESVKETLEKVFSTSLTTLEIMAKNSAEFSLRNKMKSTELLVPFFEELLTSCKSVSSENKVSEVPPKVSIVTHVHNMKKMFKLPIINFRTNIYENMEWIILDTSDEEHSVRDMLPPEDKLSSFGIKYYKESSEQSKGAILNKAVEYTSNDIVIIMEPDDFFYQNGIMKMVQNLQKSGKDCVGMSSYGCFHISRYISIINITQLHLPYYERVYHGSLCFKKSFWEAGRFSENSSLLKTFLHERTDRFSEMYYEEIMIGLIHNLNPRGTIPDNQDSNGCHFNLSEKVFKFVCSLETEIEREKNEEEETDAGTNAETNAETNEETKLENKTEVKEI